MADTQWTGPSKKVLARINEVLGWGRVSERSPPCYECYGAVITSSAHTSANITTRPISSHPIQSMILLWRLLQSLAMNFSHKTLFHVEQTQLKNDEHFACNHWLLLLLAEFTGRVIFCFPYSAHFQPDRGVTVTGAALLRKLCLCVMSHVAL